MSKLLRKSKLSEDNSYHISQIKASTDSLIATHAAIATVHQDAPALIAATYTDAEIDALIHEDSIPLYYAGVADGASLGFYETHPAIVHPAADNNSRSYWIGYMPKGWTTITNGNLKILFSTGTAGDTASFGLRVDAATTGETCKGNNLYNAVDADYTTVAADVYTLVTRTLAGSIVAGDLVAVRMQKTTIDTRPFNIAHTLWIERV